MKATVINLDSRPERMVKFAKNKFPFVVERFSAFNGGENGCTSSHLNVIKSHTEFPFVVFEDDCVMLEPWEMVKDAMEQLPFDWDALWLGATLTRQLKRYSRNLFRLNRAYCLHAVIYNTQRMVDYILHNHNTQSGRNLDIFYYHQVQQMFNCFITYPIMATQSEGISDIANKETGSWIITKSYNKYTNEIPVRELR
jgi:GR25 family glycosyltransferase involved in LPS biosynthesis